MKNQRFGLIINPYAKGVRKRYILSQHKFWEALLEPGQYQLPEGIEQNLAALDRLLEDEIEVLGILGGDGTMNAILNDLLKLKPPKLPAILPLRGGTINALCNNIGTKDSPEDSLKKMTGRARSHPTQFFKYLIKVSEQDHGHDEARYGFTFANGVFPKIFQAYYGYPNPGPGAAARLMAKIFFAGAVRPSYIRDLLSPVPMRIDNCRGKILDGKIRVLAVSTLESPTLWWKPFGPELNGKPQFHYLANAMTNPEAVLNMFDLLIGRCHHARHVVADAEKLLVECDTGYVLDGELVSLGKPLKIKIDMGPVLRMISL